MDAPSTPLRQCIPGIGVEDFAFHSSSPAHSPSPHPIVQPRSPYSYAYEEEPSHLDYHVSSPAAAPLDESHHEKLLHSYESASHSDPLSADEDYEDDMARINGVTTTTSSRSSISSIPASVSASAMMQPPDAPSGLTTKAPSPAPSSHEKRFSSTLSNNTIYSPKQEKRDSPFRHPGSVRAMQMNDEEDVTRPKFPRSGSIHSRSRLSGLSARSITSPSPSKKSRGGGTPSPQKPKVKKEYPLVLLHCTLLPPSLPLPPGVKITDQRLLQEVVPEGYWRRWKLLQEKIGGSMVVRDRGILIPHPRNEYDVLEERLLESLELREGRVRGGHFLGADEDGIEEGSDDEEEVLKEEELQGQKCPDCGRKVVKRLEKDRKWEVKVYAANGLMRAGAWAAAWTEMERVDVEVGVWLPEEIRRELEQRVLEEGLVEVEEQELDEGEEERRRREVYGEEELDAQERIDGLLDEEIDHPGDFVRSKPTTSPTEQNMRELDFQTLLTNYLKLLAKDRRNVVIFFLSVLVLFFAVSSAGLTKKSPAVVEMVPTPVIGVAECTAATLTSDRDTLTQIPSAIEDPVSEVASVREKEEQRPTSVAIDFLPPAREDDG